MADTSIEWTQVVWNPTTGCDRVSPGCDNCYALKMAKRLKGMGSAKYQRDGDPRTSGPGFGLSVHADTLTLPLGWKSPRRVFVNSMSDLFHDEVPDEFIAKVFAVMAQTPQHTYQLLTKRHGRMRSLLNRSTFNGQVAFAGEELFGFEGWRRVSGPRRLPLDNVWLGVSVEDQKRADLRIPALLDTPAAVRWLSCEPLLGPLDLTDHLPYDDSYDGLSEGVDWVVVGGESGAHARAFAPNWVRDIRDQCAGAGVPFFFKQWGGRTPKAAGRELDGRTWDEYPAERVAEAVAQ